MTKKSKDELSELASEGERLERLWSRRMAIEGFKKIYRVSIEGARTEILGDNGEVVDVKYNPSAANAARAALESLNRLLGYSSPVEEEVDDDIVVILGDAEEFSK